MLCGKVRAYFSPPVPQSAGLESTKLSEMDIFSIAVEGAAMEMYSTADAVIKSHAIDALKRSTAQAACPHPMVG